MSALSDTLRVRVTRRWAAAEGIDAFELAPEVGQGALPPYEAGAHIDVHLPNGLVRQYSLCGLPERADCYRIAVLREATGRGGSRHLHDAVRPGMPLRIGRPRQAFGLRSGPGEHSVLLAGGVGITPLLAMAYALRRAGHSFELHYFVRSRVRAAFLDELGGPTLGAQVVVHASDEHAGPVPALVRVLGGVAATAQVYACGPAGFLQRAREGLLGAGHPVERFHEESFVPVAPGGSGTAFEVRVASTGRCVTVGPEETVAAALARIGVPVPLSCEQGICGTCLTGIREGVPEHRDQYLSPDEQRRNDCFTPCCSRALTPLLVLDL